MMKKTVGSGQADGLSVELPVLLRPVPLDRNGNAGKGDSVPRPIGSATFRLSVVEAKIKKRSILYRFDSSMSPNLD